MLNPVTRSFAHALASASHSLQAALPFLGNPAFRRTIRRWAALSILLPTAANALPYVWETVTLPAASGAACADGSPYRFFVNRNPLTTKTMVMFEGGGACWTQGTCVNKSGSILSAVNPNGIPENYMSSLDAQAKLGLVTPFTSRVALLGTTVQTQSWNMVYVSYCTGDTHLGNKVSVYSDEDPASPRVEYHRGNVNVQAVAAWMKKNMARPDQLLVTGFSAGGVGSTAQYAAIRESLNPKRSALLADSGPLYPAPRNGSAAQYPSLPLHNTIRSAWGLDDSAGIITQSFQKYPGTFDVNNMGSVTVGLARLFPNDRLGFALFQEDADFSRFSYLEFFPEIKNASGDLQKQLINAKWRQDISAWTKAMNLAPANLGYYIPYGRPVNMSHCLTIASFDGTGIDELLIPSVGTFVDNLLSTSGVAVIRANQKTQKMQPTTAVEWFLINVLGLA
ncbi:MAG: pectin acetylesterase-family hydrolase [bacterium]|nr:pectin acetylesterase-family hydrolase [bacterium]